LLEDFCATIVKFSRQNAHHDVVMPRAGDACRFAFAAFLDEAAGGVATDCAKIIGDNAQAHPVQAQLRKCVTQEKANGFAPQAFAKPVFVVNADGQACAPVAHINRIEANTAEKPAFMLDDPGTIMRRQTAELCLRILRGHRWNGGWIATEHVNDFGSMAQCQPLRGIAIAWRAQEHGISAQGIHHVAAAASSSGRAATHATVPSANSSAFQKGAFVLSWSMR